MDRSRLAAPRTPAAGALTYDTDDI
jgi:hypothetical protein